MIPRKALDAAQILVLVIALSAAFPLPLMAGDDAGEGDSAPVGPGATESAPLPREELIPEPMLPGLEMLPEGVEPPPWKAFGRGQDIDRLTRISIEVSSCGGGAIMNQAGKGDNAPTFSDIISFSPGFSIDASYSLAPSISIGLSMHVMIVMANGHNTDESMPDAPYFELDENTIFGATLDLRLKLPLSGTGRMLRFSRAEAPTGLSLAGRIGLGPAFIGSWNARWYPMGEMYEDQSWEFEYWGSTVNLMVLWSAGIEYRFVNFGIRLEFGIQSFGAPAPSTDPAWAEASEAGSLVMAYYQLSIGVHF